MQEKKEKGPRRHYKEDQETKDKREQEAREREIAEIARNKAEFMASQGLLKDGEDLSTEEGVSGASVASQALSPGAHTAVSFDLGDDGVSPNRTHEGDNAMRLSSAAAQCDRKGPTSFEKKEEKIDDTSVVDPLTGYSHVAKMETINLSSGARNAERARSQGEK